MSYHRLSQICIRLTISIIISIIFSIVSFNSLYTVIGSKHSIMGTAFPPQKHTRHTTPPHQPLLHTSYPTPIIDGGTPRISPAFADVKVCPSWNSRSMWTVQCLESDPLLDVSVTVLYSRRFPIIARQREPLSRYCQHDLPFFPKRFK